MSTHITHEAAETRVDRGFFIHLGVFAIMAVVMLTLNFNRNPDSYWSYWAVGGWGLGVAIHALCAFAFPETRERMIARTADRMERRAERREERAERREERLDR